MEPSKFIRVSSAAFGVMDQPISFLVVGQADEAIAHVMGLSGPDLSNGDVL